VTLRQIIKPLPYPLRQGIKYVYGLLPPRIRYGRVFWETYNFLQESQWWSREKLEEYQMQQLSRLLHHAYENVPYYRRIFDEWGIKPKDIQDFGDMRKLPFLTKDLVRENLQELVARNYPKSKLQYVTTGGSTGTPLGFYQERVISDLREWAFMLIQWERVGFKMGDRCVILRGNVVTHAYKGKLWEYDPINRYLILSSYHMNDVTLPEYVTRIRQFKPDFIQAYPSAITILAMYMKANNIEPFKTVKAILCGSENLYQWQRELLEEVFQCRVYSWYGQTEKVALAGECEKSSFYHIFPEYGFVEIIGKDGQPAANGELGEIVATGFNNYACPLIRYRTGDLAVVAADTCRCGRNYPLIERVEGRVQEFLVAKDGSLVPLAPALFSIHDAKWSMVKKVQFVQEEIGKVTIRVVKDRASAESDVKSYLLGVLSKRLEGRCELSIEFVEDIPLTQSGKHRYLEQHLPIKFGG